MGFSRQWKSIYGAGQQDTRWPWSDVVSLVFRHVPDRARLRVLEVGCGTGANAPLFLALGAAYAAVEGSHEAVAVVHRRFPALRDSVVVGDFTCSLPEGPFDLVVDRASITHNSTADIRRVLDLVFDRLRPGGTFIGVDWFSDRHSERAQGTLVEDAYTFTGFESGNFEGCGRVHFSDESHLRMLFGRFDVCLLTEKTVRSVGSTHLFASFNIVAKKPLK